MVMVAIEGEGALPSGADDARGLYSVHLDPYMKLDPSSIPCRSLIRTSLFYLSSTFATTRLPSARHIQLRGPSQRR